MNEGNYNVATKGTATPPAYKQSSPPEIERDTSLSFVGLHVLLYKNCGCFIVCNYNEVYSNIFFSLTLQSL